MVSIRKAMREDAQAIIELRNRAIIDQCSAHYSPQQLSLWTEGGVSEHFLIDVEDNFYVAEKNQRIVGSGKLNIQTGMVDAIFVDPDYLRQGVATCMLAHLQKLAHEYCLTQLQLEATLNAAAFYRTLGFVGDIISTYHSPRGISLDCVPMRKSLQA